MDKQLPRLLTRHDDQQALGELPCLPIDFTPQASAPMPLDQAAGWSPASEGLDADEALMLESRPTRGAGVVVVVVVAVLAWAAWKVLA